jgi:alkylated DNA repair dioxygenase AlkB
MCLALQLNQHPLSDSEDGRGDMSGKGGPSDTACNPAASLLAERLQQMRLTRAVGTRPPSLHALTSDGQSWLLHVLGWLSIDDPTFLSLWRSRPAEPPELVMMGRRVSAPRHQRSFGVDYSFSGHSTQSEPMSAEPLLESIASVIGELLWPTTERVELGALLNYYDAALGHYIGPHSDNERILVRGAPIFSFSWGQTRVFQLTPRKGEHGRTLALPLAHGDLVVMGGRCQQTHKHELLKPSKLERIGGGRYGTRRLNLTVRAFNLSSGNATRAMSRTGSADRSPAHPGARGGRADSDPLAEFALDAQPRAAATSHPATPASEPEQPRVPVAHPHRDRDRSAGSRPCCKRTADDLNLG